MSIHTRNPTVQTNPDQGGTDPVSGMLDAGHGSTVTSCSSTDTGPGSSDSDSAARSARWSAFQSVPPPISLKLEFSWSAVGDVDVSQDVAGSGTASLTFKVEYSLDGGSNWITQVSKTRSVSGANVSDSINESGSETVTLTLPQDISQIQVRDRMDVSTSATAPSSGFVTSSAGVTTTVSSIQLEVTYADQMIVMGI